MAKHLTKCPICNGTGKVEDPKHMDVDVIQVKKEMALKLHEKGFSLRQIQKALGYKSVRSVHLMIKKNAS
jgi:hypothetical protein